MESVKKSIDERALHKREYDSRVNERQMQTKEEKVDTSKALNASLVDIKSSGTESREHDTSSKSGNDAHADDADIRPIYDEEPKAEVQVTAEINVFSIGQQHAEQPDFNNEGEVDQNAEQRHNIRPLPAKLTDNQITELLNQSLKSENICLKKTVAKFQKDFSKLEAHCINLELQLQNNVLKSGQQAQILNEESNEAKVKHDIDVIETINIELEHKVAKLLKENETLKKHYKELNQSVVRQPTAFKFERPRISKQQFASQVDVNNDVSKPVTTHYLPKERESAVVKPHHVIASSESRNNSKNMLRFSSNDMVPSHKTTNKNKPIEQISIAKKQERQIPTGLRWVPTGKIFTSSTTKVDSETPHGSNTNITNLHECMQTLDSSANTSINVQEEQTLDLSASTPFNLKKERIKAWIKENVISGRPRLHGITLIHEISARQKS
ncbi:hypothetical protein Tco_1047078 [Tanacetum coccineum]